MAKELPYFKFEPNQWENGNIQMLSRNDKGLFIDLCAMYWSRLGDVPFKLAVQKLCDGNATAFNSLLEEQIFEVIDGNIYIKFLSEQLMEFENTSQQNSKNAKDGWVKRRKLKELSERNATASKPQCESDAIREEEIKEDKIKKDNNIPAWDEFLTYAKEKEPKINLSALKNKYDAWVVNGWKNGNDRPIKNWKSSLLQTLIHLPKDQNNTTGTNQKLMKYDD